MAHQAGVARTAGPGGAHHPAGNPVTVLLWLLVTQTLVRAEVDEYTVVLRGALYMESEERASTSRPTRSAPAQRLHRPRLPTDLIVSVNLRM